MLIYKQTFTDLQIKLNTDIPIIRQIDLWNEEIDMYREELPVLLPACFIEFLPTQWNTIGNSSNQHGYQTIKIHVVQNILNSSQSVDGEVLPEQSAALSRFDLIQEVHNSLQNFKRPYFDALDRIAVNLDHNHDGLLIDVIEYRTILKVNHASTNSAFNTIIPLPDISVDKGDVPESNSIGNDYQLPS